MALSRKKKFIIGGAGAAVLALVVLVSIFANSKDEPEVTVQRIETRAELRSTVTASGEVRPVQFSNMTSEVSGRIEEIFVNPGDYVQKGQPLVRLDPSQLQASQEAQAAGVQAALSDVQNARQQVTAAQNQILTAQQGLISAEAGVQGARQQVVSAQTAVDAAQVEITSSQRELKRVTDLIESGVASRLEYDTARDRLERAQVALRNAQAQLQQQKIAVEEARVRVNTQRLAVQDARNGVARASESVRSSEARANQQQAFLRRESDQRSKSTQLASISGVVADIPARVGQFATANFQSTPLLTIADMSTVNVEVNVDETEIAAIEVGQAVKIKVDALGEKEIDGVVKQKNPLAVGRNDTTGGISARVNVQEAKEFKVVIEMRDMPDDVRSGLRPNMTATATITTKTRNNVVAVPLGAIVTKSPQGAAQNAPASGGGNTGATPTPTPEVGANKPKDIKGVYVLTGNKVKFVEIETGITSQTDIEVTNGIKAGDEVVTGPSRILRTLRDGATVKRQARRAAGNGNNQNAG